MQRFGKLGLIFGLFLLATTTFFTGINWGLPSRDSDRYLFGGRPAWSGAQIMQLAGAWDDGGNRGADIAMHPLDKRNRPIVLNDTDAKRAEIVRRFRLYSNQPDEMITFRSLARMKPGRLDLDPRLYQYGGLWIYPIGGLLKLASVAQVVTLRTDLAFYLDHPEAFGRFYLVARGYSAMWGLLGVFVVFGIGREWTGKFSVGITAAAIFACLPVVINAAHEAKPHLPGTVLTLSTLLFGLFFARTGARRWWLLAATSAGAATGMVLTGYAAFAVLPVMMWLRPIGWKRSLGVLESGSQLRPTATPWAFLRWVMLTITAGCVGVGVFVLTNPYLPYDYFFNPAALKSNVGNYGTFYKPGISIAAIKTTARLLIEGLSIGPAIIGCLGLIVMMRSRGTGGARGGARVLQQRGLLLAAPAALVLLQFVLLAEGKAAEYARFAITFDVIVGIVAAAAIYELKIREREKTLLALLLVAGTLFFGCRYDMNCLIDNRADSSRRLAAARIDKLATQADTLVVWSEPAPYCTSPVNLFTWKIVLLPRGGDASSIERKAGIVTVQTSDDAGLDQVRRAPSPISWANKPFVIRSIPAK